MGTLPWPFFRARNSKQHCCYIVNEKSGYLRCLLQLRNAPLLNFLSNERNPKHNYRQQKVSWLFFFWGGDSKGILFIDFLHRQHTTSAVNYCGHLRKIKAAYRPKKRRFPIHVSCNARPHTIALVQQFSKIRTGKLLNIRPISQTSICLDRWRKHWEVRNLRTTFSEGIRMQLAACSTNHIL